MDATYTLAVSMCLKPACRAAGCELLINVLAGHGLTFINGMFLIVLVLPRTEPECWNVVSGVELELGP